MRGGSKFRKPIWVACVAGLHSCTPVQPSKSVFCFQESGHWCPRVPGAMPAPSHSSGQTEVIFFCERICAHFAGLRSKA